jgi:hypothetical protein
MKKKSSNSFLAVGFVEANRFLKFETKQSPIDLISVIHPSVEDFRRSIVMSMTFCSN